LDIIFGESGKIDHPKLSEKSVDLLISDLKSLKSNYDVILLDTSSGLDNGSLQLLLKSEEIILVTSPEPTSVMDGYVVFKMLKSHGVSSLMNVIINKCIDKSDAEEAFENLGKAANHFLGIRLNYLGWVSFSSEVVKSIKAQEPLFNSLISSKISSQIEQLTRELRIPTIG